MKPVDRNNAPRRIDAVIIGAGQAGLATSAELARQGVDHMVLERGDTANSWRHERWDSLRLLTPNWQNQLPGYGYRGADRDGFMSAAEVANFISDYAHFCGAPVQTNTTVTSVTQAADGFCVATDQGDWQCRSVVLASGPYNRPVVPAMAANIPGSIRQVTASDYRNADELESGGVLVVGAAATGLQITRELQQTGRQVTLAVGEHVRMPRTYRGKDIQYWMQVTGLLDQGYCEVDDLQRVRGLPSPQLIGHPERIDLDLNVLRDRGVDIVGRVAGLQGNKLQFSGSLRNMTKLADLKQQRMLAGIDEWINQQGLATECPTQLMPSPTRLEEKSRLDLALDSGEIKTIVWATGFKPDYSWLEVPVLDHKGRIGHQGGITTVPGLYTMGLPFMRKRKSGFIFGAGDDARFVAGELYAYLGSPGITQMALNALAKEN